MHLSNHWSLSGLLHPHGFMTSLKPLPCTAVILLHWTGQDRHQEHSLMGECVIPVCSMSLFLINGCGLKENWMPWRQSFEGQHSSFLFFAPTSLIYPTCRCASSKAGSSGCVLDVLRKIKDLLGLGPCNRLKAAGNLLRHHRIHDQSLILQKLKGVWGVRKGIAFV